MTPPDGRVELVDVHDAEEAFTLIEARHRHLASTDPELARDLAAPDIDGIREWAASGQLHAVRAAGLTVGALAVAPGEIGWLTGAEVKEEANDAAYAGQGYAASAQTLWAHQATAEDPGMLMIGTIVRRNHASRRTAEKAGRPAVLEDVFVEFPR
jgi:hypothetical protein